MLRSFICILIDICLFLSPLSSVATPSEPFWKSKSKAIERIENGEILVSVHSGAVRLEVAGGGHVKAPRDFVFNYARDFEHIDHLGLDIEQEKFDPVLGLVHARVSAFGHRAALVLHVQSFTIEEPRRIQFEVKEGLMTGLKASLTFQPLEAHSGKHCEVGIEAKYDATQNSIPKFLLGFGLEVVLQRMAVRLRQKVEAAYRQQMEAGT